MKKPNVKDYFGNGAMHAAMAQYARDLEKKDLKVVVIFEDGSEFTDQFPYATKEVTYKTPDGETYSQSVSSSLIRNDFLPGDDMRASDFKKAFINWLSEPVKSIKWSKAE